MYLNKSKDIKPFTQGWKLNYPKLKKSQKIQRKKNIFCHQLKIPLKHPSHVEGKVARHPTKPHLIWKILE